MKYLSLILILGVLSHSVFAQKKYVDPNERQKRGLMEEGEKPAAAPVIEGKIEASKDVGGGLTPQQSLCECKKLQAMNDQLINLWWSSDDVNRAMTSKKELEGRRDNIKETMVYIVATNRDGKDAVDPDKCPDTEIAEKNIKQLKKMVTIQEKKCDVYKLRGIDNE